MSHLNNLLQNVLQTDVAKHGVQDVRYHAVVHCSGSHCCTMKHNVHVLMRDERKKQARSNKQTRQSNSAHPRQLLFLRKMSYIPRVGLEPTTLYTLDRALYHCSSAGWAQISHTQCTCICTYICRHMSLYTPAPHTHTHTIFM